MPPTIDPVDSGSGPLVGREPEVELFGRRLDEARRGSPRILAINGEAGIGKTRLLAELAQLAHAAGFVALAGTAVEFERELPFAVAIDALDPYLERLDPASFDRLAADGLEELAQVFPALGELALAEGTPSLAGERFRAHDAVRELVERIAAREPVLLSLDDLHWADGASLELVASLVRRPPEAATLIAVACRTGQRDPELEAALDQADETLVTRLELRPLDRDHAAELAGDVGAERGERLYEQSGGNPFYLLQLAKSGGGSGAEAAGLAAAGAEGVPPEVAASIAAELETLPNQVRAFAEAAAASGDPFEVELGGVAAGLSAADARAAVEHLATQRLVRETTTSGRFAFRHPLVRHAVYQGAAPSVRLEAHRRLAAALAEREAPATERARHIEESARHGDEAAVATLREAGEATARRAPASAARWFAGALRLLPRDAPAADRLALIAFRAQALAATGRFADAHDALLEALDLVPDDAAAIRVRLIVVCARLEQLLGYHDDAKARLTGALEAVTDKRSVEAVSLMIALSRTSSYLSEYEPMRDWAARALEPAREIGDRALIASATAVLALSRTFAGAGAEAATLASEAELLVDAISDEELAGRLDAASNLATTEMLLNRFDEGARHAERGLEIARSTAQQELLPLLVPVLATTRFMRGELEPAAELLAGAVDASRLSRNADALALALCNRAMLTRLAGDPAAARESAAESVALARSKGDRDIVALAGGSLVAALRDLGDPEQAIAVASGHCGGPEMPQVYATLRAYFLERLTHCHLDLADLEAAERTASAARRSADETDVPLERAAAARAEAAIALAGGRADEAERQAMISAASAESIGARIEAALARTLAGRALVELGERERAASELQDAADELDSCGALRYRDEAERELGKLGRRPHRRSERGRRDGAPIESLSGRELEVATLAAAGRTNREIAAELFLSVKTIESHLRNIFAKVGASSRDEVAELIGAGAGD